MTFVKRTPDPARAAAMWMLVVFTAPFLIYGQTFSFDFVNYDDNIYVYDNPMVQQGLSAEGIEWAFSAPRYGNYDPVTWVSYMIDVQAFGRSARGHHIVNVVLHALNAVLLFLVLRSWTGETRMSVAVALLFAVHPLRVESVAWVSGRKDVLSMFFMLAAFSVYTQYVRRKTFARYLVVVALFVAGLLSKPMLVTFPLLLLLVDYWPLRRLQPDSESGAAPATVRGLVVEKLPLMAISGAVSLVTLVGQESAGIMRTDSAFPIANRVANALQSYATYLLQTVWPARLVPFYPNSGTVSPWPVVLGSAVLIFGLSAIAIGVRKKHPFVLTGWAWYLLSLVPVIGIVQVGLQAHADRYTYVPQIGILVAAVWGGCALLGRFNISRNVMTGIASAAVVLFGLMAYVQAGHWRNSETLWKYTIKVAPENALAHQNLGIYSLTDGDINEAEAALQRALELSAANPYLFVAFGGPTLNSLGAIATARGDYADAIAKYDQAAQLLPGNAGVHSNYGEALLAAGRFVAAEMELTRAVELDPAQASAWNALAYAAILQDKPDAALEASARAVALEPDNAEFRFHMALAEFAAKRYAAALEHIDATLAIDDRFGPALALQNEIKEKHGGSLESP